MQIDPISKQHAADSAARRHDKETAFISFGRHHAWKREAAGLLLERAPEQGGRALDLCCGTGDMAFLLCEQGKFSVVVGVDNSPALLDAANVRSVARESQGARAPLFIPGNALRLPFADEELDAAAVSFGLSAVEEPQRALSELYRVMRPGAVLAVLDSCRPSGAVQKAAAAVQFGPAARLLFGQGRAERISHRAALEKLYTPEELRAALAKAGFTDILLRRFVFGGAALAWGVKPRTPAGEAAAIGA